MQTLEVKKKLNKVIFLKLFQTKPLSEFFLYKRVIKVLINLVKEFSYKLFYGVKFMEVFNLLQPIFDNVEVYIDLDC